MFPADTKFLVVDDFATMRKIIRKALLELGYSQVEEADDGKPALEMLKKSAAIGKPFHIVISDWNMPTLSGFELLKSCKNDPQLRSLPFVLITTEGEQKNILEAAKAGVSDYMVKPFNAEALRMKLEKVWFRHYQKAA